MKRISIALALSVAMAGVQANVNQGLHLVSEGMDRTTSSGSYGALSDQGSKTGTGFMNAPFETQARASSSVAPGALTASAYVSFDGPARVFASSFAEQYDSLTFHTDHYREALTVRYNVALVAGSTLSVEPIAGGAYNAGNAHWGAEATLGNPADVLFSSAGIDYDGHVSNTLKNVPFQGGLVTGLYTFETHITSTDPWLLQLHLDSQVSLNTYTQNTRGEGGSLTTQSLYWGGIVSVTHADGTPVSFTLTSDSGMDYFQSYIPAAVPEPASAALSLSGLGLLAAWAGRRGARRRLGAA